MYNRGLYEPVQSAFRRDPRTLVGMLPADEWPRDWRRIKWEISTNRAIDFRVGVPFAAPVEGKPDFACFTGCFRLDIPYLCS